MKKLMTLMLSLSFLAGTVSVFAQDAPPAKTKKHKKEKKSKKSKMDDTKKG